MANTRSPLATQQMNERDLNDLNTLMRDQSWYKDWFRSQGLDPNKVKLSESQRNALSLLAEQQGLTLGDRMKFDEAGNVNQKGGFAGMPGWAKGLIAGGAIGGSMLIPGVGPAVLNGLKGSLGFGGGGGASNAAMSGSGAYAVPEVGSASASGGGGMNILGGLKDFFLGGNGKKGMDPTSLLLGGLSLLGGDGEEVNSFKGTSADPVMRMTEALDAIKALSNHITSRGPARLKAPNFEPPAPVDIPGLGFQIGGGLGRDPSLFGQIELPQSQFPDLFGGPGGAQPRGFAELFANRKQNGNS